MGEDNNLMFTYQCTAEQLSKPMYHEITGWMGTHVN